MDKKVKHILEIINALEKGDNKALFKLGQLSAYLEMQDTWEHSYLYPLDLYPDEIIDFRVKMLIKQLKDRLKYKRKFKTLTRG